MRYVKLRLLPDHGRGPEPSHDHFVPPRPSQALHLRPAESVEIPGQQTGGPHRVALGLRESLEPEIQNLRLRRVRCRGHPARAVGDLCRPLR